MAAFFLIAIDMQQAEELSWPRKQACENNLKSSIYQNLGKGMREERLLTGIDQGAELAHCRGPCSVEYNGIFASDYRFQNHDEYVKATFKLLMARDPKGTPQVSLLTLRQGGYVTFSELRLRVQDDRSENLVTTPGICKCEERTSY